MRGFGLGTSPVRRSTRPRVHFVCPLSHHGRTEAKRSRNCPQGSTLGSSGSDRNSHTGPKQKLDPCRLALDIDRLPLSATSFLLDADIWCSSPSNDGRAADACYNGG